MPLCVLCLGGASGWGREGCSGRGNESFFRFWWGTKGDFWQGKMGAGWHLWLLIKFSTSEISLFMARSIRIKFEEWKRDNFRQEQNKAGGLWTNEFKEWQKQSQMSAWYLFPSKLLGVGIESVRLVERSKKILFCKTVSWQNQNWNLGRQRLESNPKQSQLHSVCLPENCGTLYNGMLATQET